jgi:hypothetical protein
MSNKNYIISLMEKDGIDIEKSVTNCKNLVNNPIARRQGVFAFLQILNKIFKGLSLDPSKIQTMININDNLNELEEFLKENGSLEPKNSVESEI